MTQGINNEYRASIVEYYDSCEIDYRMLWRLDRCMAMHFGYWDETTKGVSDALLRENQILSQRVNITAADKVLDAGCGVGGSSIWLAKNIGCQVTGITLSLHQVNVATRNAIKHHAADKAKFEARDFTATGYPDASFDVVWAVEAVCHAEDKADFIREAYRILKPGGRLIVADFFAAKASFPAEDQLLMDEWADGWSIKAFGYSGAFRQAMETTGFADTQMQDASDNVRPSAKRLYQYSLFAKWGAKLLTLLRIRNAAQYGNVRAVHRQWLALNRGLWHYGIFSARKPG